MTDHANVSPHHIKYVTLSKISVEDDLIIVARDSNGVYFVMHGENKVIYEIDSFGNVISKKPATAYIIHRTALQNCFRILDIKYKRDEVSKIARNVWEDLKKNDPGLVNRIKEAYKMAMERHKRVHLEICPYVVQDRTKRRNTSKTTWTPNLNGKDEHELILKIFI
ncbi:5008_t:CDS:2 [Acaulospora morrowiae]|uniref:5008_t:CDS:1 n=1 Tax=Acaulospora morrowiae TaxID=94023 RepID=A0A9N9F245_9GLOM|nr:5008_t:CDS:2 [Acaulospora morrowiae]